jgi:hypothetical protein
MVIELSNPIIFILPAVCLLGGYLLGRFGNNSKQREQSAVTKALAVQEQKFVDQQKELSDALSGELGTMREGLISTIRSYQRAVNVCAQSLPFSSEARSEMALPLLHEDVDVAANDFGQEIERSAQFHTTHSYSDAAEPTRTSETFDRNQDVVSNNKASDIGSAVGHSASDTSEEVVSVEDSAAGEVQSNFSAYPAKSFEERYAELMEKKKAKTEDVSESHFLETQESFSSAVGSDVIKAPRAPGEPKSPEGRDSQESRSSKSSVNGTRSHRTTF